MPRLTSRLWLAAIFVTTLFGTGRYTIALAAWLAPLAALRFVRGVAPLPGFLLGAAVHAAAVIVALWGFVPLSPLPHLLFSTVIGLSALQPVLIQRLFADRVAARFGDLPATLLFPVAATALEHLGQRLQPFGTWGGWGYTQVGFAPFAQLAALTGLSGLTFLIAWCASTVDLLLLRRAVGGARAAGVFVTGLVIVAGALRLALAPATPPTVKIGIIGSPQHAALDAVLSPLWRRDGRAFDFAPVLALAAPIEDDLLARTERAGRRGAKIVLWPEAAAFVREGDQARLVARLAAVARAGSLFVAATTTTVLDQPASDGKSIANQLLLIGPDGRLLAGYDKSITVPGIEQAITRTGDGRVAIVDTPLGRIALAICFDLDFPRLIAAAGRERAVLLLAPAEDWPAIDPYHARMAALRAVENGLSLARAARHGRSLAVDAYGRSHGEMSDLSGGDPELIVDLPLHRAPVLYPRLGDVVAWGSLIALALYALFLLPFRRSPHQGDRP